MPETNENPHVLPPDTVMVQRYKTTEWRPYPAVTREHFVNLPAREIPLSPYGGRMDRKLEATGFFRTEQVDGAWTLVDPEGHPFLSMGVNSVSTHEEWEDCRYSFPGRFETRSRWAEETHRLIREDLAFNTLGNWSDGEAFRELGHAMPYILRLGVLGSFARKLHLLQPSYGSTEMVNGVLPIFHDGFEEHVDACFQTLAAHRDDPWALGVFSDNEVPLYERKCLSRYLAMGEEDPACRRARAWMEEHGISEAEITPAHDRDFCKSVLRTYFSLVRKAMDRHLPNHLYLGSRFHKAVNSQLSAYEALGEYADVISINLYHRWTPDQKALTEWASAAGKPLMITEWYAKGEDSGLRCYAGAGLTVKTQADRGRFYENFTLHLLRNPNLVGWHWFRYMDEPPLSHGANATNKGVVNSHYDPYEELIPSMRRINREVYSLRDALLSFSHPNLPDTSPVVQDPEFHEYETELTGVEAE